MSLIGIGSASGQTKRVMTSRLGSVIIRVGIGCSLQGTCGSRRALFPRNHRPVYKVAAGPPSLALTVTLRSAERASRRVDGPASGHASFETRYAHLRMTGRRVALTCKGRAQLTALSLRD